jgi:DNA helicase-2/ATP-dependent DNA helicase PcrA
MAEMAGLYPKLEGDALNAVRLRGTHIQIIAAAGSGKTEVVSQRVAELMAEGVAPEAIVAFTFTERAAEELKERIALRIEARVGAAARDRLGNLYVGTIHAYCFRLLQQRVPKYESYDVLDENQLTAFLSREANHLGIKQLHPAGKQFAAIQLFLQSVGVVENELLDPASLPDPFGAVLREYMATLERYRLLTYGQQIVRAVEELTKPDVRAAVHAHLRHLIVDEYQDVNPAQENLIRLLTGPAVELCVVGDDGHY